MEIVIAKSLLSANEQMAAANRARLDAAGVFTVNLVGSPGGGKTTLLESLLAKLDGRAAVIQGDLATSIDAERIEALGVPAVQINTGQGCHLEARMVSEALGKLDLGAAKFLFIENVGNLVCTAGFDLGEHLRVVVLSVTEGDDKVEKYPPMFKSAGVVFINKVDLLPYTNFNLPKAKAQIERLSPTAPVLPVSARTGEGIDACAKWLVDRRAEWNQSANGGK